MDIDCLDFRRLPGQNPLFLSFLYDFERVSKLFHAPPNDPQALRKRASGVLARYQTPRSELVSRLREYNRAAGAGEVTEKMLELLGRDETVTVVTGQQVGLFGGPCYTLYKAATAVRMASWLRENEIPAVPVFWMAADDSDFEEVRSASFITREAESHTIRHPDLRPGKETMSGAAPLQLGEAIDQLEEVLTGYPFAGETVGLLRDCYQSAATFAEAFGALLSAVFRNHGLILYDSRDRMIRARQSDLFATAVEKREAIVDQLLSRGRDLRQLGFEAQVAVDETETLLFHVQGEQRFKLRFEQGRFHTKERKSIQFSPEELAREARERPERFGFNALLRPILQDRIFPTAIYVGGPAEVAYFAQVNAIAHFWDVEPVILPRAGFTLVDRKSRRLLEKYNLSCEQVLTSSESKLAEAILQQGEHEEVLQLFDRLSASIRDQVETIQRRLQEIDPPLVDMAGNAHSKIDYQVDKVRQRFLANQKSRAPHLESHLSHLLNRLRPEDGLQERHFTFTQLIAEEGMQLVDLLIEHISADCLSHRIWKP